MEQNDREYLLRCINEYATCGLIFENNNGDLLRLEKTYEDGSCWCQYIEKPTTYTGFDIHTVHLFKPYLRSLDNKTSHESNHFQVELEELSLRPSVDNAVSFSRWLREKHFDCFGLIEKGLALEAPEGMYDDKKNK